MPAFRRLRHGETDFELLGLALGGATAAFGGLWFLSGLPAPACLFRAWTGLPCMACGGTRCLRHLLAGDVAGALVWNPLVFAWIGAAALFGVYALVVVAFRLPRLRVVSLPGRAFAAIRIGAAALIAANWIYLLCRFSRGA